MPEIFIESINYQKQKQKANAKNRKTEKTSEAVNDWLGSVIQRFRDIPVHRNMASFLQSRDCIMRNVSSVCT